MIAKRVNCVIPRGSASPSTNLSPLAIWIACLSVMLSPATVLGNPQPIIYWYLSGTMQSMAIDGSQRRTLISDIPNGWGLDVSTTVGKVYWADRQGGNIMRANLDGGSPEMIASGLGQPHDIVIDSAANHIYWSDTDLDKIQRADLDGSNIVDIVTGVDFVTGMHLDATNGKLYFTESATDTVRRVDLDGSNQVTLLTSRSPSGGDPRGIDIDLIRGHLYYSDLKRDAIFRANLDGSNEIPFITGLDKVFDLQILPQTDEIFWFENTTAQLFRSPLATASPTVIESSVGAWGMSITPEPNTLALLGFGALLLKRRTQRV